MGINESNGWNLKRQRGVYEALSFIETLVDTPTYRNGDNAFNDTYSHLNNQEDFLMSRADGVTTPIAMTVDGMWWQSESSHVFSSMASRYGAQYSQENSELRWMPLPKATEEKAQEAAENIKQGKAGNTIADSLYSLCFVSSRHRRLEAAHRGRLHSILQHGRISSRIYHDDQYDESALV